MVHLKPAFAEVVDKPVTIVESRLAKYDVSKDVNGVTADVEFDVDYTGVYDPLAAANVASLTPVGMSTPMNTAWGSEIAASTGIYCRQKKATFKSCSTSTLAGEFTLVLRYEEGLNLAENPLSRKDQIFWSRAGEATQIFKDSDDKNILTAAKEVFASMPTVNVPRFSCTITGYRSGYGSLRFNADKFNVVNSDGLNLKGVSVGAKAARYLSCQTREEMINGVSVVAYTWQLDFKESWNLKLLNAGNYELKDGKAVRIKDSYGLFRQSAWPLKASGEALPDGYADADVNYLDYKATVEIPFMSTFGWSF